MIKTNKTISCLLCVLALITVWKVKCAWPQGTSQPAAKSAEKLFSGKKSDLSGKKVTMDFDNVDIRLVIKFISELTGKNFILDDRVKGKVTVLSPKEIPIEDAYKIFESILEVNSYATVTSGNVIKIIPDSSAASQNLETVKGDKAKDNSDAIVTQIIPLDYAEVERVKAILQPLISRGSKILSYLPTNTLILTERVSNINRLMEILKEIDVETGESIISIISIQYADVDNLVKQLQTLFGEKTTRYNRNRKSRTVPGNTLKILPDQRTGNIIVMGDPEQIEEIKDMIKKLDVPVPREKDDIHVYFLKNSKAEDMSKVLAQIMSKTMGRPGVKEARPEVPLTVVADKTTNSLIITASPADYSVMERVLQKLDIMRPQVLVEALIAEVSYDKSKELGVEWRAMRVPSEKDGIIPFGGTNYGKINGFTGYLAGGLDASPPSGMFIGLTKGFIDIGGMHIPNLATLVAAYQQDSSVNILSTPHILTTDNEEAEIIVGQEIPFAGAREVLSNSSSNSIYSYNYKNVGLTLRLTPHINQDGYVKLEIYQEIKQVVSTTVTEGAPTPTTTIRQAKTTVVVKNNQTVVLGGMLQDDHIQNSQRVPCLGSLPLIGWAFKSMSSRGQKRNLQIFITPHVIKDPEDMDIFTTGMKSKFKAMENGHRDSKSGVQEPISDDQKPMSSDQKPETDHQEPMSSDQNTKNDHKEPENAGQKPISGLQEPETDHQEPTNVEQPGNQ